MAGVICIIVVYNNMKGFTTLTQDTSGLRDTTERLRDEKKTRSTQTQNTSIADIFIYYMYVQQQGLQMRGRIMSTLRGECSGPQAKLVVIIQHTAYMYTF